MSKFAITFPGQGSQSVGMLADLYADYDLVKQTFAQASEALGYDLWQLVANGPETELNQTHRTQPALLTASVAIWRLWKNLGGAMPAVMAGHSLGEYSALVCADVISLSDAVKLVEKRGLYMQQAVPEGIGSMAAIVGLEDDLVQQACDQAAQQQVIAPVNFNSIGQIVIAGHKAAVERACEIALSLGARMAKPLTVSVPSHCALMAPAAQMLADDLAKIQFNPPQVSVINNVDVAMETDADGIKDALVRQLCNPVRWTETIQMMAKLGIETSYEFGPGKVLSGLVKRIDKSIKGISVNSKDGINALLAD